ncbi:MAG: hypothetical protein H6745_17115 [Deltaproteobacteria bacterium]|nr:hypothetical protein [Deltaproteobacteria bacterium]
MRSVFILVAAAGIVTMAACGSDESSGTADGNVADGTVEADGTTDQDSVVVFDTLTPTDTSGTGTDTAAVDTAEPPKPGEFGYACTRNDDCNSGWCIETSQGRLCTRTCQTECPDFYDCREAPGTDATFICLQRLKNLCDPCKTAEDCNGEGEVGNYCLSYGEKGRFCGGACRGDDECPGGYVCRTVPIGGGGEAKQCVPSDGAQCKCSPLATALQKSTICYSENDLGRCEGTRFCTQSGLNVCDAESPLPESCNKRDDNCNGQVDEFPPDYLCYIENEFGTCPGRGQCSEGVETCAGDPPRPEMCNGIDDDCDGETDEDLCDDQNPCTTDYCDDDGNCQHAPDDTKLCDDGSVCTQVDKCVDGFCRGFNPLQCGDANPCFKWQCDAVAGCLSDYDNGKACEDGQPCTKADQCNQGVCVPGNWDQCDDGNPCTVDSCVSGQGCRHDAVQNNTPCGGLDGQCRTGLCQNGQCLGTPINEGQLCTYGGSVPACKKAQCVSGNCSLVNQPAGTLCGNTDVCPPCVDFVGQIAGCCFGLLEVEVAKRCDSTGGCSVVDQPQVTCNTGSSCGGCSGGCIPACGIAICF